MAKLTRATRAAALARKRSVSRTPAPAKLIPTARTRRAAAVPVPVYREASKPKPSQPSKPKMPPVRSWPAPLTPPTQTVSPISDEMKARWADPTQGNLHEGTYYPTPAAATSGGGTFQSAGSAGGEAATIADLHDIKFKEYEANLQGGNAPSWWRPFVPETASDMERPDVAYLAMLNASIPYLSPEDQRNAAAQLYTAHGNAFAIYKQANINKQGEAAQSITHEQALLSDAYKKDPSKYSVINRDYFTSKSRATGFIDALNQMRTAVGGREHGEGSFPRKHIGGTGQGYSWLQQIAGMQENYGSGIGQGQTRAQYLSHMGGLDPLFALGQSQDIGPVAAIGQMFAKPFFSAGAITPKYQTETGQTFFGDPNRLLF